MRDDSIDGIYETLKQCAIISKSAGGIGLNIHCIRATGSYIAGTNGISNGLVPMLRVFNNTARYVDQGGNKVRLLTITKRRLCSVPLTELYLNCSAQERSLSTWSLGILMCSSFWISRKILEKKKIALETYFTPYGFPTFSCNGLNPMKIGHLCALMSVLVLLTLGAKNSKPFTLSKYSFLVGSKNVFLDLNFILLGMRPKDVTRRKWRRSSFGLQSWSRKLKLELRIFCTKMPAIANRTSKISAQSNAVTCALKLSSTALQTRYAYSLILLFNPHF